MSPDTATRPLLLVGNYRGKEVLRSSHKSRKRVARKAFSAVLRAGEALK